MRAHDAHAGSIVHAHARTFAETGSYSIAYCHATPRAQHPADVDTEHVLLFATLNENAALQTEANIATRLPAFQGNNASVSAEARAGLTRRLRKYDAIFQDSMRKHAINGKLQCALEGLTWQVGERVRLHLLSMGDEELHTPTLAGHTFVHRGKRAGTVGLMASSMTSVDLASPVPGSYLLRSGSATGAERGMVASVT
eukprot:6372145-Prymnesium_polylepis.1